MSDPWAVVAHWQGPPLSTGGAEILRDYEAITHGVGLFQRSDRAWVRVTGKDRLTWLHNLSTHQVKPLQPGEGQYTFFLNVQGRIVFDGVLLVDREAVLLDIDRRSLDAALKHLGKYAVIEDVHLADESDRVSRIALIGRKGAEVLVQQGLPFAGNLPLFGHIALKAPAVHVARTDFCGEFAIELIQYRDSGQKEPGHIVPSAADIPEVGAAAVQIRRIEAGIPWPGAEITEDCLPAETKQLSRAVSFNKGCYLGQEVVERMRSRGVVARQLVGLRVKEDRLPPAGSPLFGDDGKSVGILTSACRSPGCGGIIALGYLKTPWAEPGRPLRIESNGAFLDTEVVALPFHQGVER